VDVRIGLVDSVRDLEVELPDDTDVDALKSQVADLLTRVDGTLWLTDRRGNQYAVAGPKVTFVVIGSETQKGRIGSG
jgi:hypothetical protein